MWGLVRTLSPPLSTGSDLFGSAVAISGDSIVVGSPQYNHMAVNNTGAVFVFDSDLGGAGYWGHAGTLVATDFREYGELGWSVGIFADTVVAGSFSEVLPAETDPGAAYVFERDRGGVGNWGQTRKLVARWVRMSTGLETTKTIAPSLSPADLISPMIWEKSPTFRLIRSSRLSSGLRRRPAVMTKTSESRARS